MQIIKLNQERKTMQLGGHNASIKLTQIGRRGPVGFTGPIGPTGPQGVTGVHGFTGATGVHGFTGATGPVGATGATGDPATNLVTSVNGEQGVVVLDAADVGADAAGSASNALTDANDYTDEQIGDLATVASTGSYDDLLNKPTIPTVPVTSVNGEVGDVVLTSDDVADTASNRYTNDSDITRLANTSGTNTGDQDISGIATNTAAISSHVSNTSNPHAVTKAQVGLGSVDNTPDTAKPVSTATQTALNLKANLASPALTGTPTAPTQTANNNSTRLATTAYVDTADLAHVQSTDPHPQYHNEARGDARYAGQPYSVMAKAKFASLASSYGMLGKIFGNSGYLNDLQVYGESTQASVPTPDVPVPIVSTTGNVTVKSSTKNMAPFFSGNFTRALTTFTFADGLATINSALSASTREYSWDWKTGTNFNYVTTASGTDGNMTPNGGSYTVTMYIENLPANADLSQFQTFVFATANGTTFTSKGQKVRGDIVGGKQVINVTLKADEHIAYIQTYCASPANGSYTNLKVRMQLEVGSTSSDYEPYVGTTQTLPLSTTQLRSLPNGVSDRIYKSGSSWFLEQNVGQQVITGAEAWAFDAGYDGTDGSSRYKLSTSVLYDRITFASTNMMSERFTPGVPATAGRLDGRITVNYGAGAARIIFINTLTYINDITGFKAWIAANPFVFQIQLEAPATTVLDPIANAALITALENIRTYQGITNITASTPVSGSYGLDLTASLAGKVDTTGNQTVAGVKTFSSSPIVPTATTTTQAVNKAQMDTADALKVSKAGDTMTGRLSSTAAVLGYGQTRAGVTLVHGVDGVGNFYVANDSTATGMLTVLNSGAGFHLGTTTTPAVLRGTGFPNGVVSAPVGSIYIDTAVTNGASSWIKKSGTGNTGWQVLEGDTGWRDISGSLINGWTASAGFFLIRRTGNVVNMISGSASGINPAAKTNQNFFSPTVGLRPLNLPQYQIMGIGFQSSSDVVHRIVRENMVFYQASATSAISFNMTYETTDAWPTTLPGTAV